MSKFANLDPMKIMLNKSFIENFILMQANDSA